DYYCYSTDSSGYHTF
nr:immunoglobulin light chain junction region [Macaca mulatta]MOX18381.1 immunoglobulin light chain junction region [Macaca mulatta]MOX18665.1 immunoglobulin light chain junction region [Macaca mulatta]MOX18808.1 immunoglobulin light chain junction region [Macaca mulatta]MOX19109.1 immunoglobulin light chain junction region [Macaca mulatta]